MKSKHPYFASCKDVWMQYYIQTKGTEYYWTAKDSVHLHQLMKKIESKIIALSMEINLENMVNSTHTFFHSITDKWHLENLELSKINSSFNPLYDKARKQSHLGRADEIRDSVEEYLRRKNSERAG